MESWSQTLTDEQLWYSKHIWITLKPGFHFHKYLNFRQFCQCHYWSSWKDCNQVVKHCLMGTSWSFKGPCGSTSKQSFVFVNILMLVEQLGSLESRSQKLTGGHILIIQRIIWISLQSVIHFYKGLDVKLFLLLKQL